MSLLRLTLAIAVCATLTSLPARAEGWSLTSWIPGQKDETKTRSNTTRTPLLGGKPVRSTSRMSAGSQPSMWGRMTSGTTKFFARTKNALSWSDTPEPRARGGSHSSWDDAKPSRSKKSKDGPSFFSGWFDDEPRPSKTVQGFMSQKRPEAQ